MLKTKPTIWGIFINENPSVPSSQDIFIEKYALTEFEARKFIVTYSINKLNQLEPNKKEHKPLWLGQKPDSDGYYLMYGLPGPNESRLDIIKFTTYRGWTATYLIEEKILSIMYKAITRVEVEFEKSETKGNEIVKCQIDKDKKVVRDLSNPRDAMLFAIENRRKAVEGIPSE